MGMGWQTIKALRAMWPTYNIIPPYLVQSSNEEHTKAAHQPEAQNFMLHAQSASGHIKLEYGGISL